MFTVTSGILPMLQKFLYEKPCHSCVAHAQDALHCNRRGAASRAPMAAKIGSLDAPENCPHFAAPRARVRAL
jgi:hypothetical protein